MYRRGTERPDALDLVSPLGPGSWEMLRTLQSFHVLAELEAWRLEQQGDMAGAWGWYRAALRATHHMGLRGTLAMRGMAQRCHTELEGRLATWAADPRTSPALLRQALDDAVGFGAFTPSESYTLMAEYPELERLLDSRRENPGRYVPLMRLAPLFRSRYFPPSRELFEAIADGWRFWRREPERSRRVLRLVFANWLAYDALPPERRPAADPGLSGFLDFYALGPEAPANARVLSPAALERWLDSTTDASAMLRGMGFQGIHLQERTNHRALVVLLARALYRRDHGADPPSDEALVGPYLKSLPDDGLGDQDTGDRGWWRRPRKERANDGELRASSRNFPTLRYLAAPFRWFFRSRRRVLTPAAVLLAMLVVPPLWWSIQLVGLPDIGDPFDVEAFRAFRIPEDRNAFVLYRQAADRLKPLDMSKVPTPSRFDLYRPLVARPTRRSGAGSRRTARRWRSSAGGRSGPTASIPGAARPLAVSGSWGSCIVRLALLEASRLEEQGDMTGAWGWYRADLRAIHHVARHAALVLARVGASAGTSSSPIGSRRGRPTRGRPPRCSARRSTTWSLAGRSRPRIRTPWRWNTPTSMRLLAGLARLDPATDTSLVVLARHRRHEPDPGASPDDLRLPGGPCAASRSGAVG